MLRKKKNLVMSCLLKCCADIVNGSRGCSGSPSRHASLPAVCNRPNANSSDKKQTKGESVLIVKNKVKHKHIHIYIAVQQVPFPLFQINFL